MAKIDVNLDDQKFGRWTVIETISNYKNGKTYCLCRCECRTEKYIVRHSLLSGNSKSCGCLAKEEAIIRNKKDYVGVTFGELTIVEMLYKYKNDKTYCRCLCSCGNEYIVSLSNLVTGHTKSCGCKTYDMIWNGRRTNLCGLIFGRLIVIEMLYGYKNRRTYCKCLCECGNETIVDMGNLLSGRTSSCGCFEIESRYNRKHYIDIVGQKFGLLTVIEKTNKKSKNRSIIWKCLCDCGNIVYVSYGDLTRYRKTSCGCSNYSNMENFIANILLENKINYIPQARFSECRNIYPLPFDFYLYEYNTIIEYDGEQHFRPIEYFGGNESFKKIVLNDNIKNDYCIKNNINLIRLPYSLTEQEIKDKIIHIWNP